jgi:hypothetical protein
VEDITVALGRETWLFVIASQSAFAFKDRGADPREIAAKLGVRYVLRGSVRKGANRVRIVVQLTDAATGAHIWSDRFEDEIDNVFAMNDRVMTQAAAMIAPALRSVEIERAQRKPTSSLTAFDLYLQALPLFRKSLADNQEALRLLDKAVALDRSYSAAYGFAARCYQFQKLMGWVSPNDSRLQEGDGWPCASPTRHRSRPGAELDRPVSCTQSKFGKCVVRELRDAQPPRRL